MHCHKAVCPPNWEFDLPTSSTGALRTPKRLGCVSLNAHWQYGAVRASSGLDLKRDFFGWLSHGSRRKGSSAPELYTPPPKWTTPSASNRSPAIESVGHVGGGSGAVGGGKGRPRLPLFLNTLLTYVFQYVFSCLLNCCKFASGPLKPYLNPSNSWDLPEYWRVLKIDTF